MGVDWNREQVESLHMQFLAQWRQSLSALVPAVVQIRAGDIQLKSYQQYLQDVSAQADIQVFEIDALQSLCAWSFDSRWVTTAVDCVFGGAGRIPVRDLPRRVTHIELGVRQRLVESLATGLRVCLASGLPHSPEDTASRAANGFFAPHVSPRNCPTRAICHCLQSRRNGCQLVLAAQGP